LSVPAIEIERAYDRCDEITRHAAGNFYYGIRLLPRHKRQAMSAVYAFARRVDDIVDGDLAREEQFERLSRERERLRTIGEGEWESSEDPLTLALAHARLHYDLPLEALELLVDGVEFDVRGTRYETFDELVVYCRGVAGSIGRLCLAIFVGGGPGGADTDGDGEAAALADALGVAMQLTNILRDVREDSARGRMYIPAEDLRRFDCTDLGDISDLGALNGDAGRVAALIRFEAARAEEWFDRGLRLVERLEPRSAACVLAMTGIYRSILESIERDPLQAIQSRISLPVWKKTLVAARSLAGARGAGGRG
jgi:15-cis-phytoene synthase